MEINPIAAPHNPARRSQAGRRKPQGMRDAPFCGTSGTQGDRKSEAATASASVSAAPIGRL
ncbi:MAG: hypothetical protein ACXW3G_05655 [Rhodoplanes sp.]